VSLSFRRYTHSRVIREHVSFSYRVLFLTDAIFIPSRSLRLTLINSNSSSTLEREKKKKKKKGKLHTTSRRSVQRDADADNARRYPAAKSRARTKLFISLTHVHTIATSKQITNTLTQ
jgi:hypothetical protein